MEKKTETLRKGWHEDVDLLAKKQSFCDDCLESTQNLRACGTGTVGLYTCPNAKWISLTGWSGWHTLLRYRSGSTAECLAATEIPAERVIEPETTEWAEISVFSRRENGSLCFCVDYYKFNAVTIRDSYTLLRTEECNGNLGETTVVSALEAKPGCCQIDIDESVRAKRGFVLHHGLRRFTGILFLQNSASATFQRSMIVILVSVR